MTFDEMKTVTMTQEQGNIHIAALVTHIKRMTRKLEQYDRRIASCQEVGDLALALKISASKEWKKRIIAETEKELARLRQIFGDKENAESRN